MKAIKAELENKQKVIFTQAATLARYRRFHERVKKQIRPYLQDLKQTTLQLKEENAQLRERIHQLLQEIERWKASQIKEKEIYDNQVEQLKQYHQQDRLRDLELIQELKLELQRLEPKSRMVDIAQYRADQLENEMIRLKKEHQEEREELRKMIERLTQETIRLKS